MSSWTAGSRSAAGIVAWTKGTIVKLQSRDYHFMLGDLERRARTSHSHCASPVFQMGRIIWLRGTRNPIQIGRTAILLQGSLLTGVGGRGGRCQDRGSEEKVRMDLSYDRQEFNVSQGECTSEGPHSSSGEPSKGAQEASLMGRNARAEKETNPLASIGVKNEELLTTAKGQDQKWPNQWEIGAF